MVRTIIYFPKYWHRRQSFRSFWKNRLLLTKHEYISSKQMQELNNEYDVFICGSDQIWNLDCTKGVDSAFFLEFVKSDKLKIAYAPSMAKAVFKQDYTEQLQMAINRLDYISVREKSTRNVVKELTEKPVCVAVDPTLLIAPEKYPVKKPKLISEDGKYIFVYLLGYDTDLIAYSNRLSQQYKLPVYYISGIEKISIKKHLNGTDVFGASPEEFLYYVAHANYVITTSFHATVFSVLFKKQFCVFHRENTGARTRDFLDQLELSQRSFFVGFDINSAIDYKQVDKKLEIMKKESVQYIVDALRE